LCKPNLFWANLCQVKLVTSFCYSYCCSCCSIIADDVPKASPATEAFFVLSCTAVWAMAFLLVFPLDVLFSIISLFDCIAFWLYRLSIVLPFNCITFWVVSPLDSYHLSFVLPFYCITLAVVLPLDCIALLS